MKPPTSFARYAVGGAPRTVTAGVLEQLAAHQLTPPELGVAQGEAHPHRAQALGVALERLPGDAPGTRR